MNFNEIHFENYGYTNVNYWYINYFYFIIYFCHIGILFCVRRQSIYITTYVFREYKTTTDCQPFWTFVLSLRILYDLHILLYINREPLSLCLFFDNLPNTIFVTFEILIGAMDALVLQWCIFCFLCLFVCHLLLEHLKSLNF